MINVMLVCTQGMSTNIMRGKIEEEAKKAGAELTARAVGLDEMDKYLKTADIIILGPQIKYAYDDVRSQVDKTRPELPIFVIAPQDFGMMNGSKVYKEITRILNK